MRAKRAKKAFTIVELVIVIAVIAILMAVLIPTFVSLVKKANVSSDSQLVRNLNTILTAEEVSEGKNPTMHDALTDAIENGYDITKINPASEDNDIVWNQNTDRFELRAKDDGAVHLWKIADAYSDAEGYSIYLRTATASASTASRMPVASAEETTTITASTGIDVGDRSDISVIYENSTERAKVVIRTNGGALTIKQAGGDVVRYGYVAQLSVKGVTGTYYEGGFVGMLVECNASKFVALSSAVFHQDRAMIEEVLSGPSVTLDGATYASHYYGENDRCNDCNVLRPGHVHTWKVTETETETGAELIRTYTCTVCGESYTETINKPTENPEHVHNVARHIEAKDPTCTQAGNREYWVCSCGKFFADENATKEIDDPTSVILSSKGHTAGAPISATVKAATCTEDGLYSITVKCIVCEVPLFTTTSSTPATGVHNYNDEHKCTSCGQADPDYISANVTNGVLSKDAFQGNTEITTAVIPSTVTSIGNYAFQGCSALKSVTIPASVTSIGKYAFQGCSALTSVTIPSTVTSIGNYAFKGCTALESVTISDGVTSTSIGSYAFQGCSALTSVTIPEGVTTIGSSAFQGCSALTSVTIPSRVNSISDYVFQNCTSLTNVELPEDITTISSSMFSGCTSLKSVTIPDSVKTINGSAFSGCSGLTSVTIGSSVETISSSAFSGCTSLTSVTIPDSVTSIGEKVLYNCSGLTSVIIGDGVTSISKDAFSGCTNLNNIAIGGGVTSIIGGAFKNTGYYNNNDNWGDGCLYIGNYLIEAKSSLSGEYTIKEGTLTIACNAFSGCTELTSVTIPDSVKTINGSAFSGCIKLESVTIGSSVETIGSSAFSGCTKLESVTIGSSVETIDSNAFSGCTGLTSVTIPDSVKTIKSSAFKGCTGLTSVAIGSSVETIAASAFSGCTGLTSVTIPDSVTSINDSAFKDCTGLTSVTIGSSVKTIGSSAFSGCTSLTSVTMNNSSTLETIGQYAFQNCTSLTTVTIPDSVTKIDNYAFSGCSGLTSVTIGSGVTTIGSSAFSGCTSLTSVTIPDSVTTINGSAFSGCTKLNSVTIPESVTSIGKSAFSGCTSLTSVTFENNTGNNTVWYVSTSSSFTTKKDVTVTDASVNATYLTSTYMKCYWKRS